MTHTVIFDDLFLALSDSGISRVWRSILVRAREKALFEEYGLELVLLNRSDKLADIFDRRIDFPQYDFRHPAADRMLVSRLCEAEGADAFVSSYYSFALGIPSVMMVYDLIPERFGFHGESRGWLERQLAIAHASTYIAISHNTKRDLLEFYSHVDEAAVTVVHPGVDSSVFYRRDPTQTEEFKAAHGLGDFVVMVGSRHQAQGYKNGELLTEALAQGLLTGLDVVFVGGEEVSLTESSAAAAAGARLVRLELDDQGLATCLSAAGALVYPSLYEGFGLPPVEALACGTPVVCVPESSIPEAVGPLGLPVSGRDPAELARQVRRAMGAPWSNLVQRDGPLWASRFDWAPMAEAVVATCASVINDRPLPEIAAEDFLAAYTRTVLPLQR